MNASAVRTLLVLVLTCLAVLLLVFAFFSGRRQAASEFNLQQVDQISQALTNFYQDQDRYPSQEEFSSREAFGQYFSQFPVQDRIVSPCEEGLSYSSPLLSSYTLTFCLPAKGGNFTAGVWEQSSVNGLKQLEKF